MAKSKNKSSRKVEEPREAEVVETKTRRVEVEPVDDSSVVKKIVVITLVLVGLFLLLNAAAGWRNQSDESATDDETAQVEETEEAGNQNQDNATKTETETNGTSLKESDSELNYTVGAGESYTTIARRAIATIDDELTTAERVAAETKLTTDAGAEWINEGQELVLTKETVREAVDWAKSLSDAEKAAWQPYADLVAW